MKLRDWEMDNNASGAWVGSCRDDIPCPLCGSSRALGWAWNSKVERYIAFWDEHLTQKQKLCPKAGEYIPYPELVRIFMDHAKGGTRSPQNGD